MSQVPAFARAWFEQAEADLRAAELSAAGAAYEWACFQAQQAGGKALKAFLYARGFTAVVTHSLRRLLRECGALDASFTELAEAGRLLDQHYIPTRYPNGLDAEMPPARYYEKGDAATPRARATLLRELEAFAARLGAELGVKAVYVFGSLARGDQHGGSDIDLLVIGRFPGRAFEAIGEVIRRTDLPVEPLVLSPETLNRRVQDRHPFFKRVMEEGIRLYPLPSAELSP